MKVISLLWDFGCFLRRARISELSKELEIPLGETIELAALAVKKSAIRCLDAHAHLGNWLFRNAAGPQSFSLEKARKHFEIGVKIGEMSFPGDNNIVLPWGRIDNRPFLRCLHGYGLSLWRMGETEEARRQFERMLWFNPSDNQGVRSILLDMDEGNTWDDVEG